jgi:hypothetical protein
MRYFSLIYPDGKMEEVEFDESIPIGLGFNRCLRECLGENYVTLYADHELFKRRMYQEESQEENIYASTLLGIVIKGRVLVEYV